MCKKMGLGQQALADALEMKRGKVAGYFYETQAKPDFHEKLGKRFDLNVGRFLTVEMEDANYDSFFSNEEPVSQLFSNSSKSSDDKSDIISILINAKNETNDFKKNQAIDEAILRYGKILNENSRLKDTISDLKDELLNSLRKENHPT